jgi:hypothetical protein
MVSSFLFLRNACCYHYWRNRDQFFLLLFVVLSYTNTAVAHSFFSFLLSMQPSYPPHCWTFLFTCYSYMLHTYAHKCHTRLVFLFICCADTPTWGIKPIHFFLLIHLTYLPTHIMILCFFCCAQQCWVNILFK